MQKETRILTLSVGKPKEYIWNNKQEKSAIGKTILTEALLTKEGFIGDGVENTTFHGGPERAVCLYPYEHYRQWEREFGKTLEQPAFGENLSVEGMLEEYVYIGDIFQAGEAVIQVTQGRIPCATISKHNGVDLLLKRVVETGYTGYFFRVLEEGRVFADSNLMLLERSNHEISVLYANVIWFHDRNNKQAIEKILSIKELAPVWRGKLEKALEE